MIEEARSMQLADQFQEPTVCLHPGGHFMPYTGDVKEAVLGFLGARQEHLAHRTDKTSS